MRKYMAGAAIALSAVRTINSLVLSDTKLGAEVRKNVMERLSYDVLILIRKEIEKELTRRLRT